MAFSQPFHVLAKLPRAGLGNKLLVWARAFAFAKRNDLPLLVSPWEQLAIGSLLRRERSRFYLDTFRTPGLMMRLQTPLLYHTRPKIVEPDIYARAADLIGDYPKALFVFDSVPHWKTSFDGLREYRSEIHTHLKAMTAPRYMQRVAELPVPVIAVHIRMGDFRPVLPHENFAHVGNARTPLDYFRTLILSLRAFTGNPTPVTVFSDGTEQELSEILALPNVALSCGEPAIVDLLWMAKSKLIILSAGSTFGLWSAFFSDAAIIQHPAHFHYQVYGGQINRHCFDGAFDAAAEEIPALLQENLRTL
jgi:hypothetical protein